MGIEFGGVDDHDGCLQILQNDFMTMISNVEWLLLIINKQFVLSSYQQTCPTLCFMLSPNLAKKRAASQIISFLLSYP